MSTNKSNRVKIEYDENCVEEAKSLVLDLQKKYGVDFEQTPPTLMSEPVARYRGQAYMGDAEIRKNLLD